MDERATQGEARRQGLRRARWVAAGASVGTAVVLTGTIAVVHTAPAVEPTDDDSTSSRSVVRDADGIAAEEYDDAQAFTPQSGSSSSQGSAVVAPQPHTSSGGS